MFRVTWVQVSTMFLWGHIFHLKEELKHLQVENALILALLEENN